MVREVRTPIASATPQKKKNIRSQLQLPQMQTVSNVENKVETFEKTCNSKTVVRNEQDALQNQNAPSNLQVQQQNFKLKRLSDACLVENDDGSNFIHCTQEDEFETTTFMKDDDDDKEGLITDQTVNIADRQKRFSIIVLQDSDSDSEAEDDTRRQLAGANGGLDSDTFYDAVSYIIDLTEQCGDDIADTLYLDSDSKGDHQEEVESDDQADIIVKSMKKMTMISSDSEDDNDDLANENAHLEINIPKSSLKPQNKRISDWSDVFNQPPKTPLQKKLIDSPISTPASVRKLLFHQKNSQVKALSTRDQHKLAAEYFDEFNQTIFDGKLENVELKWSKTLRKTAGSAEYQKASTRCSITLSQKILDTKRKLRETLAHEMCHLAVWVFKDLNQPPHGKWFKHYASLFEGHYSSKVFDADLVIQVPIKHDYEITYKYNYVCINEECGHIYGRHSKSIDLTAKVCGLCKGRLSLMK
ncbi:hypothetical protein MP228_011286 [Amoeboaphelidium protococcarum]|nr:hypothetical protein MP228_011286 [Amoeboaphelidium protococcarum]